MACACTRRSGVYVVRISFLATALLWVSASAADTARRMYPSHPLKLVNDDNSALGDAGAAVATESRGRSLKRLASRKFNLEAIARFGAGPDQIAPWTPQWANSIAVCATMKEENVTDVIEWIEHYQWLGVDRILLTENDKAAAAHPELQPYIDSGFVKYSVLPTPHAQLMVYDRCLEEHGDEYNWMAFFDLDEFLVLRQPNQTLKGLLNDYKFFPGLIVHWIMFGSSHRETRPAEGGVLKAYTACEPQPKGIFKTIANTLFVAGVATAHAVFYKGYAAPVNEAYVPAPYRFGKQPHQECEGLNEPTDECPLQPTAAVKPASVERLALFHYATKSRQDFELKKERGFGDANTSKSDAFFEEVNRLASHEGGICAEGIEQADQRLAAAAKASAR